MKTIWKKFSEARPPVDSEFYIRTLSSNPVLAFLPSGVSGYYQEVGTSKAKPLSPAYQWCNVGDLHEIELECGISLDDLYYAVQADDDIALFINQQPCDIVSFFEIIRSWMDDEDKYKETNISAAFRSELLRDLLEEKGDDVTLEEVQAVQSYAFRQLTNFVGKIQERRFPEESTTGTPDDPIDLIFDAWDGPEQLDEPSYDPTKDNPKDLIGSKKLSFSTLPWAVIAELAAGMSEGAIKYGKHNYEVVGVRHSIYFDALLRHLIADWLGEEIDPDTGLPHLVKAMACLGVLRDAQIYGQYTDDRPPPCPPEHLEQVKELFANMIKNIPDCGKHYDRASMKRRGEA